MSTPTAVRRAFEHCQRLTEARGPNFSVGFRLLPPEKRRAVHAAYAFCRLVDDLADECGAQEASILDCWQEELDRVYAGRPRHLVGVALADALERFPIPRDAFEGLIEGCRHDLEGRRYHDFEELIGYCELVAATIGRISIAIFGALDEAAHRLGRSLSLALQLTNILRDVREDAERGRLYLPAVELSDLGVREEDLAQGRPSPGFHRLMERNIARCRSFYAQASTLPEHLAEDARLATRLMGAVYVEVLRRIADDPERVLRERVGLADREKAELVRRHLEGEGISWRLAEA